MDSREENNTDSTTPKSTTPAMEPPGKENVINIAEKMPWQARNDDSTAALLENLSARSTNGSSQKSTCVYDDDVEDDTTNTEDTSDNSDPFLNKGYESSIRTHSSSEEPDDISASQPLIKVTGCGDSPKPSQHQTPADQKRPGIGTTLTYEQLPIRFSEADIAHIKIEEITPNKKPVSIANKITIADEYFLHSSQHSIHSLQKKQADRIRSNTVSNIHEKTTRRDKGSFLSLASNGRLGKAISSAMLHLRDETGFSSSVLAINISAMKDLEEKEIITDPLHTPVVQSRRYTKNVYMVSFCVLLNFIALGSVRNLQSSINHEGGIGVISMAVSFLGYMFASTFSTVLVQSIQPHKIFVAHLIPHFLYVAANIYPEPWLLAPVSFIQGMSLAIGWNAMSTYLTLLAAGEAKLNNRDYSNTSGKYFGIFGLFFQAYFIIGNLIASLVLTFANSPQEDDDNKTTRDQEDLYFNATQNQTSLLGNSSMRGEGDESYLHLCGANYWQHYDLGGGALYVSDETKFLLYGLYMACVATAILISVFQIEPLNVQCFDRTISAGTRLKKHMWKLMCLWVNPRFLLIVPLQMYSFMEVGFVTAEVTKAFVTCPIGIHMVGWTMMFLGICGSASSYLGGHLTKHIGRTSQLIAAGLLNILVLIVMVLWEPTQDSYFPYFALLGLWGASDGLWVAHINSLVNTVFPTKYEEAFSGLRMCQGIGVAIVFGYSNSLSMLAKSYITGIFCIIALVLYAFHALIYNTKPELDKELEITAEDSEV